MLFYTLGELQQAKKPRFLFKDVMLTLARQTAFHVFRNLFFITGSHLAREESHTQ